MNPHYIKAAFWGSNAVVFLGLGVASQMSHVLVLGGIGLGVAIGGVVCALFWGAMYLLASHR
jgi:hypothetical protein